MYDGVRPLLNNTKYRRKYHQTNYAKGKVIRYEVPNGQSLTLYPISYLSHSMDRSISCIDSWVRRGILPQTPFRHKDYKYYSGEQISLITGLMQAYNIRSAVQIPKGFCIDLKSKLTDLFTEYGLIDQYGVFQTIEIDNPNIIPKGRNTDQDTRLKPIRYKLPTGEIIPLYSIGVLAQRLSREPQVIKKWELSGALPKTPFKTKGKFRLYTQDQIDLIAEYAEACNLRNGMSIKASGFTEAIKNEYNTIFSRYGIKYKK